MKNKLFVKINVVKSIFGDCGGYTDIFGYIWYNLN